MRVITWIPCRANSVRLPGKNKRDFDGEPLWRYCAQTARNMALHPWIDSDDDDLLRAADLADYDTYRRDPIAATGHATLDMAALRFVDGINAPGDAILLTLQCTSPFLSNNAIRRTIDAIETYDVDCALTVHMDNHLRWRVVDDIVAPMYNARRNSQYMAPQYRETGGAVACLIDNLRNYHTRIHGNVKLIEVTEEEAIDIDTEQDWLLAKAVLDSRGGRTSSQ